eukprot:scaffold97178_cov63-Phaeocystis_antarctica.AAC.2
MERISTARGVVIREYVSCNTEDSRWIVVRSAGLTLGCPSQASLGRRLPASGRPRVRLPGLRIASRPPG